MSLIEERVLLVIGNGFDLACGLKTHYRDYFDFLRGRYEQFNNFCTFLLDTVFNSLDDEGIEVYSNEMISMKQLNLWDFYFTLVDWKDSKLLSDQTWNEIELKIKNSVLSDKKKTKGGYGTWHSVFKYVQNMQYKLNFPVHNDNLTRLLAFYLSKREINTISFEEFNNFVLHELYKFEENFAEYVRLQESIVSNYKEKAKELVHKMTSLSKFDICSFNYTQPFDDSNCINCHGVAKDKNVIFGIEKTNIGKEFDIKDYYKYTKEAQGLYVISKGTKINKKIRSTYTRIYFYGLSFSKQDYDYFFQLFDIYKLASTKTKFVFFYSIYDKDKADEIRENFVDSVTALINDYGEKIHCNNLLFIMTSNETIDIEPL